MIRPIRRPTGRCEMTDSAKLLCVLENVKDAIDANAEYLTDLDAAIGDSDHGINLARGFRKVAEDLPAMAGKDIGAILKKTGMDLVSTVGGSSGPLYGTAFMKAGASAAGKSEINTEDFLNMFSAAIGGVKMRGKSEEGEKTMLDAMGPALRAAEEAAAAGKSAKEMLEAAAAAAAEGAAFTKTIIATKGRAAYLGERSLGHVDPGAASFAVIMKTVAESY